MDEDLAALFKLLDYHIKGNSDSKDDQLKRFLCTLGKKVQKAKGIYSQLGMQCPRGP